MTERRSWLDLWRRYTRGEESASVIEAAAFERFRSNDRRAWARYGEEREAQQRYLDGQEPADDAQKRWFEIFRRGTSWQDGYRQELRAWRRFASGKPAHDAAELSRFTRFDRELAEHGRTPPHRHAPVAPSAEFPAGRPSDPGAALREPVGTADPGGFVRDQAGYRSRGAGPADSGSRHAEPEADLEAGS